MLRPTERASHCAVELSIGVDSRSDSSYPAGMAQALEVDGRRERARRSREAVVDAILALLREGTLRPGVAQIAARADVSERTVFRHFQDLEQLFAEAAEHQA